MVGFETLENKDFQRLLQTKLLSPLQTLHDPSSGIINPYRYVEYDNLVIVITPVPANDFQQLINLPALGNKHLLVALTGQGLTEPHIVTVHRDPNGPQIQIFDSKTSDVKQFFLRDVAALPLVRGLLRSLIPAYNKQDSQLSNELTGQYFSLGTQSFFDGVSCGYHSAATMLAAKALIDGEEMVSRERLLATLGTPVRKAMPILPPEKVDSNFTSFIKKAWQDTYMSEAAESSRPAFRHYFMGWPQEKGIGRKIVYFAGLGFIFNPLKNLVKLPTEFLLNGLSESANYLKNRLIAWAPKNDAAQYFRSGLLLTATGFQGLFKGLSLAIRTVTSPITSYRAAANSKYPALAILSAAVSTAAYAALAVAAAPIALGALAGLGGPAALAAVTPVINSITLPLTTVMYAAGAALTGGAFLAGMKKAADVVFSRFRSTSEENTPSSDDLAGFEDASTCVPTLGVNPSLGKLSEVGNRSESEHESESEPESESESESEADDVPQSEERDEPTPVVRNSSP